MSGAVVVTQALEARGQPRPAVMATVAVDLASYFVAYVLSLAVALAILVTSGHASALILAAAMLFFVFGNLARDRHPVALRRQYAERGLRRLLRLPGIGRASCCCSRPSRTWPRNPSVLVRATVLQLMIVVLDAATIWVLVRALGASASPGEVFASFMIASLLRTVGFMPGGLGTFEAASVATLALAGIPVAGRLVGDAAVPRPELLAADAARSRVLARRLAGSTRRRRDSPRPSQAYWAMAPEEVAEHLHASANGLVG